jgi:outer membrane protein OmpA-like peptidoglycan-associated protein
MFRTIAFLFPLFSCVSVAVFGQNETMITVRGKLLNATDSSGISTSILYEKLPYFDDMGIASSSSSGEFTFLLVKGTTYNISIRKDNYAAITQELVVNDPDGDKQEVVNFYMEQLAGEEEVFRLNNVIFARGSEELQQQSYAELDRLINRLKQNASMVIQLEGHTDFAGNPQANMALSEARVESVKKYLTKGGIKQERILTKAFGGSQPLSEDRTPEAMEANRRVEVRIIKK